MIDHDVIDDDYGDYTFISILIFHCWLYTIISSIFYLLLSIYTHTHHHYEGKGSAYIQDRGVSRWDTAAAQAILEAHGGCLGKLTSFARTGTIESYTYLKSETNRDFEMGMSNLTPYNCIDKSNVRKGLVKGTVDQFAPYSNLCGLLALRDDHVSDPALLRAVYEGIQRSSAVALPSYD